MKQILIISLITMLLNISSSVGDFQINVDKILEDEQLPYDEAIRFRILAHSNATEDQTVKYAVRDQVYSYITELMQEATNKANARQILKQHLEHIEQIVQNVLQEQKVNHSFNVSFHPNVKFPEKHYYFHTYPAGYYEAIVITIGAGKGENWWCVLFPPLCILTFSDESAQAERTDQEDLHRSDPKGDNDEVEVRFFLLDWLGIS